MNACLSTEVLEQFIQGQFGSTEGAAVEAHIGLCPACQRILDELTPVLVSPTGSEEPGGTALEASALDRLKSQRPVVVRDELAGPPGVPPFPLCRSHAEDDRGCRRAFGRDAADLPIPTAPLSIAGFEIVGEVGRGGMGIVYEAIELALGRQVALKVLPPLSAGPTAAARFRRKARRRRSAAPHQHRADLRCGLRWRPVVLHDAVHRGRGARSAHKSAPAGPGDSWPDPIRRPRLI